MSVSILVLVHILTLVDVSHTTLVTIITRKTLLADRNV